MTINPFSTFKWYLTLVVSTFAGYLLAKSYMVHQSPETLPIGVAQISLVL